MNPVYPFEIHVILEHYLVALLWSSTHTTTDDDGNELGSAPLDEVDAELSPELIDASRADVVDFLAGATMRLQDAGLSWDDYPDGAEQLGHDIALTRNGHGTGFWDRGYGKVGDILAEAADALGYADPYVYDGMIYP